jgi:hypothetical protein
MKYKGIVKCRGIIKCRRIIKCRGIIKSKHNIRRNTIYIKKFLKVLMILIS